MKPVQQILGSFLLMAAVTLAGCQSKSHSDSATEDTIVVKTVPVTVSSYSPKFEYSGMIASVHEAKLSFKIGGIISRIFVREGDYVKKGQLLATLDLTEINAQVKQAIQNVDKLSRDEVRMKNLLSDTAATLEQYQNTQTQLNVGKENLRIAQFNQAFAQIRAAANGTIAKKIMNEGEFASAGTPVLMMNGTSDRDWVLRFGVSDKDWSLLRVNDPALILVDAYPNQSFKGSVTKIEQSSDPSNGTYEVEVSLNPGNRKLAPGLFATVSIQSQQTNQQLGMIPVEALSEADKKTGFIYSVNEDGKSVSRHQVQIAFIEKDSVAIVGGGLQNIHEVVKEGVGYLTENARVKLIANSPQN